MESHPLFKAPDAGSKAKRNAEENIPESILMAKTQPGSGGSKVE